MELWLQFSKKKKSTFILIFGIFKSYIYSSLLFEWIFLLISKDNSIGTGFFNNQFTYLFLKIKLLYLIIENSTIIL